MQVKELLSASDEKKLEEELAQLFAQKASGLVDEALLKRVREKTEKLVYSIPRDLLLAPEDYASDLYIQMRPGIDKIIWSYRVAGGMKYVDYLKGLLRLRLRSVMRTSRTAFEKERALMAHDPAWSCEAAGTRSAEDIALGFEERPAERSAWYESEMVSDEDAPYGAAPEGLGDALAAVPPRTPSPSDHLTRYTSIHECYQVLVNAVPRRRRFADKRLSRIYTYLRDERKRKYMCVYFLSNVTQFTEEAIESVAELFDVSPQVFIDAGRLAVEAAGALERQEELAGVRNHHWVRYVSLARQAEREEDPRKKRELEELRDAAKARLDNKISEMRSKGAILSSSALAKELRMAKSTVSRCCRIAKEDLGALLEDRKPDAERRIVE